MTDAAYAGALHRRIKTAWPSSQQTLTEAQRMLAQSQGCQHTALPSALALQRWERQPGPPEPDCSPACLHERKTSARGARGAAQSTFTPCRSLLLAYPIKLARIRRLPPRGRRRPPRLPLSLPSVRTIDARALTHSQTTQTLAEPYVKRLVRSLALARAPEQASAPPAARHARATQAI